MKSLSKSRTILPNVYLAIAMLSICISLVESDTKENYKIVQTLNGKVRGVHRTTKINKFDFYAFRGIPYAKTPTGKLRFKVSRHSLNLKT